MNYLAHFYLCDGEPELQVGGLLGDFVKGPLAGRYGETIERGIALHRKIDAYTDAHPLVCASRRRISPARRRFAGIMIDMFYDHFLARSWTQHSGVPLKEFASELYVLVRRHDEWFPPHVRRVVNLMTTQDWLGGYSEVDAIGAALDRLSKRIRRENAFGGSVEELESNYAALERDFRGFLPDLIEFANTRRHAMTVV